MKVSNLNAMVLTMHADHGPSLFGRVGGVVDTNAAVLFHTPLDHHVQYHHGSVRAQSHRLLILRRKEVMGEGGSGEVASNYSEHTLI